MAGFFRRLYFRFGIPNQIHGSIYLLRLHRPLSTRADLLPLTRVSMERVEFGVLGILIVDSSCEIPAGSTFVHMYVHADCNNDKLPNAGPRKCK